MIVLIANFKKHLIKVIKTMGLTLIIAAALSTVLSIVISKETIINTWWDRFEGLNSKKREFGDDVDQYLDHLVFKLQEFYYEERE